MIDPGDERIAAIKTATELSELADTFGTDSIHESYSHAKQEWAEYVGERQRSAPETDGLPGTTVTIDGHEFHIHGVTHAGTAAEQEFLREHITRYLEEGAVVYCEQGIRPMYFEGMGAVCEMDDYLWAMAQCEKREGKTKMVELTTGGLETMIEDINTFVSEFRETAFSLIDAGSSMYGEQFEQTLGEIAAEFLTDHTDSAIGNSYESFQLNKEASENPAKLFELQQYYERTFLPQPLEREWLKRHDPELEIISHARNERMADYAVYHNETASQVHLIVGAAHQPGVAYYLEQYRDGKPLPTEFDVH